MRFIYFRVFIVGIARRENKHENFNTILRPQQWTVGVLLLLRKPLLL